MSFLIADRVKETTTTTGTGTVSLAGAVSGFDSFSAGIGNGNNTYYCIASGAEWEVGIGTYTAAGSTLSRDTVLSSSNADALVSFSAGTKDVFCTAPAGKLFTEGTLNAATSKATPVDADTFGVIDSAAANVLKKVTWANIKATIKAYFDTIYYTIAAATTALALKANLASPAFTGTPSAPTAAPGTNTDQLATTAYVLANAPAPTPEFPSGTRMPFNQTSAPTGWVKDTTAALNDSIMRIVTGTVGSGGATAFSTFNGQSSVGATTLSIAQMPSHTHSYVQSNQSSLTGGGGTNTNGTGTTGAQGGGGSHTHSITTNIKYNDFIIASKT